MVESFNLSIDYVPVKRYDDLRKRAGTQFWRIKKLEVALRKYGDHLGTCYKNLRIGDCNCGFKQALEGGK